MTTTTFELEAAKRWLDGGDLRGGVGLLRGACDKVEEQEKELKVLRAMATAATKFFDAHEDLSQVELTTTDYEVQIMVEERSLQRGRMISHLASWSLDFGNHRKTSGEVPGKDPVRVTRRRRDGG